MTLEEVQKRKREIEAQIGQQIKLINDLKMQITGAEENVRRWTDEVLVQRGQLIELDTQINELTAPPEVPEEESKKRGKKNEESKA